MLFEFELLPIEAIEPWGTPPDLSLQWFGLTYGFYRLKVGDTYLLNFTDEITEYWAKQYPALSASLKPTWVDYQVVRLWEDILELLPHILQPVPEKLHVILEQSHEDTEEWIDTVASRLNIEDEVSDATAWIYHRQLDVAYLSVRSSIRMWTGKGQVHIRWDNRAAVVDGIRVWSAQHGQYSLSIESFLKEVHSFHERLMGAMEERVTTILRNNGIPSVDIDLKHLEKEQAERRQWLDHALSRRGENQEIEFAIKIISENNLWPV